MSLRDMPGSDPNMADSDAMAAARSRLACGCDMSLRDMSGSDPGMSDPDTTAGTWSVASRGRADTPLARVPPRRHRLERLHAGAGARVESRGARRHGRLPGAAPGALRRRPREGRPAGATGRDPPGLRARPLRRAAPDAAAG